MNKKRVIVAGAGPAGLSAAIRAADSGASVTVLEKMRKPGRKLLLTGNGRCNLTNLSPDMAKVYERPEDTDARKEVFKRILERCSVRDTLDFFREIGVSSVDRGGWVYPRSGQALSVLKALLAEAERLGVRMKYDAEVSGISFDESKREWQVESGGWVYTADSVILACGGMAAPETGSSGGGFMLARSAGHHIISPVPALAGLIVPDPDIALASGARTPAALRMLADGSVVSEESGEVQWTDYGMSGIAVFQLSRVIASLGKGHSFRIAVDLTPDLEEKEIVRRTEEVCARFGARYDLRQALCCYTHERLAAYLAKKAASQGDAPGLPGDGTSIPLTTALLLKRTEYEITGARPFEHAQISVGGVDLAEVNPDTLESLIAPGLYFAGEILDADGPCGGYNLQWAWSSGYAAGCAAGKESI